MSKNKKPKDERLDEIINILYIFAFSLAMAVDEFNERMSQLKTGKRAVRGNEGVTLGSTVVKK